MIVIMRHFLLTTIVFFGITELFFWSSFSPKLLQYDFDNILKHRYSSNQTNVVTFLGNYSIKSPLININKSGFRGPSFKKAQEHIAVVGSSEVMGPGLTDDETIAGYLQLNYDTMITQVLNLGRGGYGPAHHKIVLDRVYQNHSIDTVILRVALSDRFFKLVDAQKLILEKQKKLRRDRVKGLFKSSAFLFNRASAQVNAIRSGFSFQLHGTGPADEVDAATKMWEDFGDTWQEIIVNANNHGAKVVFLLPNPTGALGNHYLCEQLLALSDDRMVSTIELGPQSYGLQEYSREKRELLVAKQLTLRYDPHSNRLQTKIIADKLHSFLTASPRRSNCELGLD